MVAIKGLGDIHERFKGVLCDVWGVLHNGIDVYGSAMEALRAYRSLGGRVILISNAPRPSQTVMRQLENMGIGADICDGFVTSGDVSRALIAERGESVFHLGPERDRSIFDDLSVSFADAERARTIVCTGLFDDDAESPENYRDFFAPFIERECLLICANPDLVVNRGDRLVYCAGSLAALYGELGGKVLISGKPHPPIYEQARARLESVRGESVNAQEILAIGDGLETDGAGAKGADIPFLYISGGIHAREYEGDEQAMARFFAERKIYPQFWQSRLGW